jgi:hypothetical protein
LFSISRIAEKESHAWTPSVGRKWHQLPNNICFPFPGLQKKKAMLDRDLLGEGCVSYLIIDVFPFPGLQKKRVMLGRHLAGVGCISCFLFLAALSLAQGRLEPFFPVV